VIAVAANKLTAGSNVNNTTYLSAPLSPGGDREVVVFVASMAGLFALAPPTGGGG
jgi:hypothetical protein